ncbi:MAG: hypothetical protein F4Y24_17565 [Gemmatimonadetes bacterium]|nr:hypothetical protein [Gemmatimonadota bacterium]MYJ40333.1 hypothetical protein [Gemmatimonadota bacterium]
MRSTVPPRRALLLSCAVCLCFVVACESQRRDAVTDGSDLPLAAVTEAMYTVGAFSGEDWETFGRIADVDFDASGNLYILDEGNYRVVVVNRDGALVRTLGSQGEGPGELSGPTSAAILDDGRLVVYDMGFPGALEVFDQQGTFVSSTPVDPLSGMPGQLLLPLGGDRMVTTGGMTIRMAGQDEPDEPPEDAHLRDIDIFSLGGTGKEVLYRAWNLPPDEVVEDFTATNAQGQNVFTMGLQRQRAFRPWLHIGVLPDGRVAVADSVGYRVKLIGADGSVTGVIQRDIAPEPVTEAIQEGERARRIEGLTAESASSRISLMGGLEELSGEAAEQLREQMLPMIENMLFPDEIPVVAGMAVDGEGRLWIARTAPGGDGDGPIDIMSAQGDYIGTLPPEAPRIPDAFGPDGLMAYIETDEMDVPSVRVIRLAALGSS